VAQRVAVSLRRWNINPFLKLNPNFEKPKSPTSATDNNIIIHSFAAQG
jgi:hypothetical protein